MKQRNPEAVCGNCIFWMEPWPHHPEQRTTADYGQCRKGPRAFTVARLEWCGEHPDFFKEIDQ